MLPKRVLGFSAALLLGVVTGCGGNPAGAGDLPPELPPVTMPPATGSAGVPPGELQALGADVVKTYQGVRTLRAFYDNRQSKGSASYFAKVQMTFAKPRKLRLDIKDSSDGMLKGATVVWLGGPTLRGRKDIGPIPIKQEHKLTEKANLRGWLYNQTDYEAMVRSLVANLPGAKLLGTSKIGDATVTVVEFKSSLPGAATERVGVDTTLKLPVYREFREAGSTRPVFTTTYTNLRINVGLSPGAFDI